MFAQRLAELTALLDANPDPASLPRTVDIPFDRKAESEAHVFARRVLEAPFSRIVLPVDCPVGQYALCVEDAVPPAFTQVQAHQEQKQARGARARGRGRGGVSRRPRRG